MILEERIAYWLELPCGSVCAAAFDRDDARKVAQTSMKTTRYFREQVLRKRPYIKPEWCEAEIADPLCRELQPHGRIRHWKRIPDTSDGRSHILRVVTLDDGETVHNAFFDRNFREPEP